MAESHSDVRASIQEYYDSYQEKIKSTFEELDPSTKSGVTDKSLEKFFGGNINELSTKGHSNAGTEWMLRDKGYADRNFGAYNRIIKENITPQFLQALARTNPEELKALPEDLKNKFNNHIFRQALG